MANLRRRDFLKTAALGAGGALLPGWTVRAQSRSIAANDHISVGVIGVGSRGQHMMRRFLRVPGVKIGALCDIWEPRFEQGRRLTGVETPVYPDHREMLEREPDLDAILVATPLGLHAEHMVAALESGRHVYGEKAMGFTVAHCNAIRDAAGRSDRLFQVGHQYRYAPWYRQAVQRILLGEIGRVTHIYSYWHRNYNWRRPLPSPELERQINWRLYREHSGGLLAELGSHHIDVANWIFEDLPQSVMGTGGITFYRDGRETFDNVQALYTYPEGRRLFFSSIIGNHRMGFQFQVFGTGGGVSLTLEDGAFYYEPMRKNSAVPHDLEARGSQASASLSTAGDMPYRGPGQPIVLDSSQELDADLAASTAFFQAIRTNTKPFADEMVGWASAVAVSLGNQAIQSGQPVTFSEHLEPPVLREG
jgi:predicted dehydrogenase